MGICKAQYYGPQSVSIVRVVVTRRTSSDFLCWHCRFVFHFVFHDAFSICAHITQLANPTITTGLDSTFCNICILAQKASKWPGSSSRATKMKGLTFTNPSRKRHPLLTSTVAWRFVCWHIKDVVCMWTWRAFDSTFLLGEIKLPLPFSNNSCGRTEQEFHHNSLHWASQSWCWTISSSSSTT